MTKTIFVNAFGGPSVGKSTFGKGLSYHLSLLGVYNELITEFVKDLVHEDRPMAIRCQPYIFGKQLMKHERVNGKVQVAVTDSPLLLSMIYGQNYGNDFMNFVYTEFNKFHNINLILERNHDYEPKGRLQDEAGANDLHIKIKTMLDDLKIPYTGNVTSDDETVKAMALHIKSIVENQST